MGSWAGRIPAMAERVHVSHSALSMVLLCGGLGAVLSFPVSSRMMGSLGARKTLLISGLALLAVLVAIGIAPTVPLLMLAVLMLGITASTFDVAINSAATSREKRPASRNCRSCTASAAPAAWSAPPWAA
jgi:predicted MFS family arabinose efflux permease